MAVFTYSAGERASMGNLFAVPVTATWSSSTYTSGGEPITAEKLGLTVIKSVSLEDSAGYTYDAIISAGTSPTAYAGYRFLLKAYQAAGGTSSATSGGTPAGTNGVVDKVYHTHTISYIKGSKNTSFDATDKDLTDFTNGALVSSLAAANNTTALTIAAQPDFARNVCILHKNNSGGAAVAQVACTYAVVGTFNGAAQTDTITFADTSNVANTKYRGVYGTKPFDSITSITPSLSQNANMQRCAGIGSVFGLPKALYTPSEADVVKITKQGVAIANTGLISTANNTVTVDTTTDNDNISIKFATSGYLAAPAFSGSALATHTHTISASSSEVSGSLTAAINMIVIGY